jgi:hypothetical protein
MASITFDASNEAPIPHKITLVSILGKGFTHCAPVDLSIHLGDPHSPVVLLHVTAHARENGEFTWSGSITPQRACDAKLGAAARDITTDTIATTVANVVCP